MIHHYGIQIWIKGMVWCWCVSWAAQRSEHYNTYLRVNTPTFCLKNLLEACLSQSITDFIFSTAFAFWWQMLHTYWPVYTAALPPNLGFCISSMLAHNVRCKQHISLSC